MQWDLPQQQLQNLISDQASPPPRPKVSIQRKAKVSSGFQEVPKYSLTLVH